MSGTAIRSDRLIKPGTKLLSLNDKSKAASRDGLSEMETLVMDKLSMVSSDSWIDTGSGLLEMETYGDS